MVGNKGGMNLHDTFGTTKISFVTCHLAADNQEIKNVQWTFTL